MLPVNCNPHVNRHSFMVFRATTSLMPMPDRKGADPIDIARGRRVKEAREALDLTQKELAAKVPCDSITISRIELGKQAVTPRMLKLLAVALRRSQEWIWGGSEGVEDDAERDPYPLRRELRSLSAWRQAAPEVRRYLLDVRVYAKDLETIDEWLSELRRTERRFVRGELALERRDGEEPIDPDDEGGSG